MSRYSRFDHNLGHRELKWEDACNRLWEYLLSEINNKVTDALARNTSLNNLIVAMKYVRSKDILPSMRLLTMAGPAAARDNTCIYNCSYLPIDSVTAFTEILYILMQGTGVGFSISRKHLAKLPQLPTDLVEDPSQTIVVEDSTEGWCDAFDTYLNNLFAGRVPTVDVFKVRPAGTVLKTKGGRASGPEPFLRLLEFVKSRFLSDIKAGAKRLSSRSVHDIVCMIGDIVVVGGVRRSALISLGDQDDETHRTLKSGNWWEHHVYRSNANNSAIFLGRPSAMEFNMEWEAIYDSKSGERGIWNLSGVEKKFSEIKRSTGIWTYEDIGCNPCSEILLRPRQFCNLSTVVARPFDNPTTLAKKVKYATFLGTLQATLTHFPYLESLGRKEWTENAHSEALLGLSFTGIFDCPCLTFDRTVPQSREKLVALLDSLRKSAKSWNAVYAKQLGINPAAAITCIKPEGTTSALCGTSSGLHPPYANYYIRRAKADAKDPLVQLMESQGFIPEEDCGNPSAKVFSFPLAAANGVPSASPCHMMDLYLIYQKHWCDHKPSITINYETKEEFLELGKMLYENWDDCIGITVFPKTASTHRQLPFEEISKEKYDDMVSAFPPYIDFSVLTQFERADNTLPTFECTGSTCAITSY